MNKTQTHEANESMRARERESRANFMEKVFQNLIHIYDTDTLLLNGANQLWKKPIKLLLIRLKLAKLQHVCCRSEITYFIEIQKSWCCLSKFYMETSLGMEWQ